MWWYGEGWCGEGWCGGMVNEGWCGGMVKGGGKVRCLWCLEDM